MTFASANLARLAVPAAMTAALVSCVQPQPDSSTSQSNASGLSEELPPCLDSDGDGFDDCQPDHPLDQDDQPADCDDGNPAAAPGAQEVCNGIDDDCDGVVDEECVPLPDWGGDPTDPPGDGETPDEPDEPSDGETPDEPGDGETPDDPDDPSDGETPDDPGDGETPDDPDDPSDGETPDEPDDPSDGETPGECVPGSACDDGNACTVGDTCYQDGCVGKEIACDDENPCTDDACDPEVGCAHTPVADGTPCDDGNACTGTCEGPVVERYAVWNAKGTDAGSWPNANHGFIFNDFFGSQKAKLTFLEGSTFEVLDDGTAVMHGLLEVTGGPSHRIGEQWTADLTWTYRGQGPAGEGWGGPKKELKSGYQPESVTDAWRYYDLSSGTLFRTGTSDWVDLTQSPADSKFPLQVGFTANGKSESFGASSWFLFVYHSESGVTTGTGDLNCDLEETEVPCEGTDQCIEGMCTGEYTGSDEVCDGADNDCDGEIDEGFGVGQTCDPCDGKGSNACVGSPGSLACTPDGLVACL